MAFDNNAGTNKLANVLSGRINAQTESPLILDFGSINTDYSLITNTFPVAIPKGDYTVCRHISGITLEANGGAHGGHESGNGFHSHSVPVPMLSAGDRVLVAWVQHEAVVIDVIMSSASL